MAQYQYQQQYYERLRAQQRSLQNWRSYNYNNDPYYSAAPIYRYNRGGRYYEVNQYGANVLQQAVRLGYQEGIEAGRADREDRWRSSYQDSFAYQDGNFGYQGYYGSQDEYNYYFREGFRRGYEDGYNGRYSYGTYSGGQYNVLAGVLSSILNLTNLFN
jgi:flagellar biosynthesis/type III secretory pathway protein FliH